VLVALSSLGCAACHSPPATIAEPPITEAPRPEPQSSFRDLFVDADYGCTVDLDGITWCWGRDPAAELGRRSSGGAWTKATSIRGLGPAVAIDGKIDSTCVVLEAGVVECWHWPSIDHRRFRRHPLSGVTTAVDVELGEEQVCALTEVGEVHCAAFDGTDQRRVASHAIDLALSSSSRFACALDASGGVWCWGGTTKVGPNDELLLARLPGAVEIEINSGSRLLARFESGEVRAEPVIEDDQDLPLHEWDLVAGVDQATALAHDGAHGCVIADRGQVRCFGSNSWAQLGVGDSIAHEQPVTVAGIEGARLVATCTSLSCAATHDAVSCWGTHETTYPEPNPSEQAQVVVATQVESVVVNFPSTCVSNRDGTNSCWGAAEPYRFDSEGEGLHAAAQSNPLNIDLGVLRKRTGNCYLDTEGHLACVQFEGATFGTTHELLYRIDDVADYAYSGGPCWIRDQALHCSTNDGSPPRPTPELRAPIAVAGGQSNICAIHAVDAGGGGKVGCFHAVTPDPDQDPASLVRPELLDIPSARDSIQLLNYDSGYCYATVNTAGGGSMWCLSLEGELLQTDVVRLPAFDPIAKLVTTAQELCALTKAGQVQCSPYREYEIRTLEFDDVIDIASAENHWCVLQRDGTLTCMGDTRWGQLGQLPESLLAAPTRIVFER
jgi:hypothetical protein